MRAIENQKKICYDFFCCLVLKIDTLILMRTVLLLLIKVMLIIAVVKAETLQNSSCSFVNRCLIVTNVLDDSPPLV